MQTIPDTNVLETACVQVNMEYSVLQNMISYDKFIKHFSSRKYPIFTISHKHNSGNDTNYHVLFP
jgi:hypothetical protein